MNKFDVETVIGEGAYGVVLKCRNRETGSVVAIKKFKESEDDAKVSKTMMREVRLLRLLSHGENIVTLHEAFRRKGRLYLVFEYAERNMLELLEHAQQGVPDWQVRLYTFQLLKAIAWCHEHGVLHRDIKPENLLLNADHSLRLCDFGFACSQPGEGEALTDYVATRWYRAPELLLGSNHYCNKVDVWAVGCIMGELSSGEPAFPGESEIDQLYIIQKSLGALTPAQNQLFLQNPRFAGLKFPDMSRPAGLHLKYGGRLPKLGVDCLRGMLVMCSSERHEAARLLRHPWFAELAQAAAAHAAQPQVEAQVEARHAEAGVQMQAAAQAAAEADARLQAQQQQQKQAQAYEQEQRRAQAQAEEEARQLRAQQQAQAELAAAQAAEAQARLQAQQRQAYEQEQRRAQELAAAQAAAEAEARLQAQQQAQQRQAYEQEQRRAQAQAEAQQRAQAQAQAEEEARQLRAQQQAQAQAQHAQAQAQAQARVRARKEAEARALAEARGNARAATGAAAEVQAIAHAEAMAQPSPPPPRFGAGPSGSLAHGLEHANVRDHGLGATGGGTRKRHVEDEGGFSGGLLGGGLDRALSGGRRASTRELRMASDELERRLTRAGLAVGSGAAGVRALASASHAAAPPQEREQRELRELGERGGAERGHTQLQSLSECGSFGAAAHSAASAAGSRQGSVGGGSVGGGSAIGGLRPRRPAAARGAQVRAQSAQHRPTGTERGRLEEQYQLAQYERMQREAGLLPVGALPVGGHARHLGYGHGHQHGHQRSTATVAGLVAAALDGDARRAASRAQPAPPAASRVRGAKHRHPRSAAPSHSANEIYEEMYELGGSPRGGGADRQLDYDDAPRTRRRQHAPGAGPAHGAAHGGQRWPPPQQQMDRPATALLASSSGYGQQQGHGQGQARGGAPLRGTSSCRQPPVTRQQARSIISQHGYAPQQIAPIRSSSRYGGYGGGGYGSLL